MNAVAKISSTDHTAGFKQTLTRLTLRNDAIFFIALVYSMRHVRCDPMVIRGQRAPAATDGVTLYYDGELLDGFSLDDRQFIMVHEIMHTILYHATRRGIRQPNLWNIACDYVVNGILADTKGNNWKMPKEGIQPDKAFEGKSAEQVYDLLMKEAQEALAGGASEGKGKNGRNWVRGEPDGPGQGGIELEGEGNNPVDVKDYKPDENEGVPTSHVEREIGLNTEKALQAAKAAGQGSHLLKEFLHDAQVEREPWYSHLRRYMNVLHERTYNWARINARRAVLHNVVAPDMRSESMGDIVLVIDESGSLTNEQLSAIGAHSADIFREARPKRVIIMRHTDVVTDVEIHEGPDYSDFQLQRKSTGGTDFRPAFDYIAANHGEAQVILWFTDMYGPFPESFPIDTMWVTSTPEATVATPFGERILADFND